MFNKIRTTEKIRNLGRMFGHGHRAKPEHAHLVLTQMRKKWGTSRGGLNLPAIEDRRIDLPVDVVLPYVLGTDAGNITTYPKGTMRATKAAEADKARRIAEGDRTPVDLAKEIDEIMGPEIPEPEPGREATRPVKRTRRGRSR